MKKSKSIWAVFLALVIGLHPILISAASGEYMPVENEPAAREEVLDAKEEVVEKRVVGTGEEAADAQGACEEIVEIPADENEEPRAAGFAQSNVSYSPVTGNSDAADLPEGDNCFVKGDTVWFNMQVGQDVQITRASLTIYKDGEVYASYFHRSESPFFQHAAYQCELSDYGKIGRASCRVRVWSRV